MKKKHNEVNVDTKVIKIDYQNEEVGNGLKTVFYCPSYLCPEGRMCVIWGKTNFKVGDEVSLKGRFNGDVFLVWNALITKKA